MRVKVAFSPVDDELEQEIKRRKKTNKNINVKYDCSTDTNRRGAVLQMGFILRNWILSVSSFNVTGNNLCINSLIFPFINSVRIWDLAIFVPNILFFLFLALRFNRARLKLRATSSPIFATFYSLVCFYNSLCSHFK